MIEDQLKRSLTGERIMPSGRFASQVMERVLGEARTPEAIRFPWRRALPGFVFCVLVVFVLFALLIERQGDLAGAAAAASVRRGMATAMGFYSVVLPLGYSALRLRARRRLGSS